MEPSSPAPEAPPSPGPAKSGPQHGLHHLHKIEVDRQEHVQVPDAHADPKHPDNQRRRSGVSHQPRDPSTGPRHQVTPEGQPPEAPQHKVDALLHERGRDAVRKRRLRKPKLEQGQKVQGRHGHHVGPEEVAPGPAHFQKRQSAESDAHADGCAVRDGVRIRSVHQDGRHDEGDHKEPGRPPARGLRARLRALPSPLRCLPAGSVHVVVACV